MDNGKDDEGTTVQEIPSLINTASSTNQSKKIKSKEKIWEGQFRIPHVFHGVRTPPFPRSSAFPADGWVVMLKV